MGRTLLLRSLCRSASLRSSHFAAAAPFSNRYLLRHFKCGTRSFLGFGSSHVSNRIDILLSDCRFPSLVGLRRIRCFSVGVAPMPDIKDPEIKSAFKDLMAINWDDLPDSVIRNTMKALSKNTDDKGGQEALENVFRAAEAVEEFNGILMSLKMELDDLVGMSGENVQPLSKEHSLAILSVLTRYTMYLQAFKPEEMYLRKKVENELGSKMIYLKMRCSGLDPEWGQVTVLGTSGLSGSYVEQRA